MMNLQRREEIRVIAECPNDMRWAQEMRRAVAELLAHIDTLESMRSRLCAALGLPADSAPETVEEALNHTALVGRGELSILRDFAARRMRPRESDRLEMTQDGYAETLRALRANQGGAKHA